MVTFTFAEQPVVIRTVEDMLEQSSKVFETEESAGVWFRGQAKCSWPLRPNIGRKLWYGGTAAEFSPEQEAALLERFRRYAYAAVKHPIGEWEALFFGRHHGLPVRLLDWTANALVALFFACLHHTPDENGEDGAVWAFLRKRLDESFINVFDPTPRPLDIKGIKLIYPFYIADRLITQRGAFTIQENPRSNLEDYANQPMEPDNLDLLALVKWRVERSSKGPILGHLERLDINRRRLFPELDGLGEGLWEVEVMRKVTDIPR